MPKDEMGGGTREVPVRAGVEDVHLQTVDTLPTVCSDVLTEIHRGFARVSRTSLSEFLEADMTVSGPLVRQTSYADYLSSLAPPVFSGVVDCEFLSGPLVATTNHGLASSLLDRLLGGPGRPVVDRWPTEVDTAMFWGLLERLLGSLQLAFRPLTETTLILRRLELSPHFLSVAPHDDPVIVFEFNIALGDDDLGAFTACYPFSSLTPLVESLPTSTAAFAPETEPVGLELEDVGVRMRVTLNPTRMSIGEFLTLQTGDVVLLDHWADQPAWGQVSGQTVMGVQLGQMNGHMAAVVDDWRET